MGEPLEFGKVIRKNLIHVCKRGIRLSSVYSPHKEPVTRQMFPFDDIIMFGKRLGSVCQIQKGKRC